MAPARARGAGDFVAVDDTLLVHPTQAVSTSGLDLATLSAGRVVEARVVSLVEGQALLAGRFGTIQTDLGGAKAAVGDILRFEVRSVAAGDGQSKLTLALVERSAPAAAATGAAPQANAAAQALASAVGRAAAGQSGLAPLYATLAGLVAAPAGSVPEPVRALVTQLMNGRLGADGAPSGAAVAQAFRGSGLFLESRLAATPTAAVAPSEDLKAGLMALRDALSRWVGTGATTSWAAAAAPPSGTAVSTPTAAQASAAGPTVVIRMPSGNGDPAAGTFPATIEGRAAAQAYGVVARPSDRPDATGGTDLPPRLATAAYGGRPIAGPSAGGVGGAAASPTGSGVPASAGAPGSGTVPTGAAGVSPMPGATGVSGGATEAAAVRPGVAAPVPVSGAAAAAPVAVAMPGVGAGVAPGIGANVGAAQPVPVAVPVTGPIPAQTAESVTVSSPIPAVSSPAVRVDTGNPAVVGGGETVVVAGTVPTASAGGLPSEVAAALGRSALAAGASEASETTAALIQVGERGKIDRGIRPPPPRRGQAPRGQAALPVETAGGSADEVAGLGRRALERADGALQRILLEQYAVLDHHDDRAPAAVARHGEWTVEIPIASGAGTGVVQMTVERDGGGQGAERQATAGWRVRFALDIEPVGPVTAQIGLAGEHLSIGLWIERPEVANQLAGAVGQLRGALEAAAIPVEAIHVATGRPTEAPRAAASGRFVDVSL